jgi:hypothetical protein
VNHVGARAGPLRECEILGRDKGDCLEPRIVTFDGCNVERASIAASAIAFPKEAGFPAISARDQRLISLPSLDAATFLHWLRFCCVLDTRNVSIINDDSLTRAVALNWRGNKIG